MAQARKPTPAAAPTAGSAFFFTVSLVATSPTFDAAPVAAPPTLETVDEDAGRGGAGASVAVAAAVPVTAVGAAEGGPPGRVIGAGPAPPAGPAGRLSLRRPILRPRKTGSYFVSTTRSFIGMMPLSVMWMPSGHTSLQHLVMLQ